MTTPEPSVFTRIIDREIPATIVAETDRLIAIEDINPQAPLHVLVIPKTQQYRDVVELAAGDPALLAELVALAGEIAGRAGDSFRLVFNTGADAGQTVFHVHAHVLAGRLEEGTLAGQ
ncbi:HIT domain-containing protein [Mycetocola reblochoni]|uniref:HIT domain-containing protein n=1 Tax=Mycetocola reblochoni TaxID=331618 RepID=A0A3L6ZPN0_9MICO|nr:HIT domain-containing protein [Mycetocola reblochoni]RLP69893.1 HIT domain-containing protein [Mycetocola reblochoni]